MVHRAQYIGSAHRTAEIGLVLWPTNKQSLKEWSHFPAAAMTTGRACKALQGSVPVSFEVPGFMHAADDRVERSLYARATGYSYDAVKIFHTKDGKIIKVPYTEHVPPDVGAICFWLKNRRPDRWRDVQNIEAEMAHYVISEKPLSESDWVKLHAIDLEAEKIIPSTELAPVDAASPQASQESRWQ